MRMAPNHLELTLDKPISLTTNNCKTILRTCPPLSHWLSRSEGDPNLGVLWQGTIERESSNRLRHEQGTPLKFTRPNLPASNLDFSLPTDESDPDFRVSPTGHNSMKPCPRRHLRPPSPPVLIGAIMRTRLHTVLFQTIQQWQQLCRSP